MGNFLKNSPGTYDKYVIMYGGDLPAQTVKLIALENKNNQNIKYIWASNIDSINPNGPAFVLFMENNDGDLNTLKNRFPNGNLVSETESHIWVYYFR